MKAGVENSRRLEKWKGGGEKEGINTGKLAKKMAKMMFVSSDYRIIESGKILFKGKRTDLRQNRPRISKSLPMMKDTE